MARIVTPVIARRQQQPGPGDWIAGVALGPAGARRYRLYRPPGVQLGERLPLIVMLHGCGQDAQSFAASTKMNRVAARERFLVLYPEQDRMSNAQGCWNWFETRSGRHHGEAALIMKAIDQVCLLYSSDRAQVAVAGLSAGASMAALLVTRHPERFKAVVMHSG
ncbi:MAG: PHB depolymerase family esterase, partial [Pseudomonadota bacterium]|nr:PHB depolymerase family esterase [Pseudomonadota bacterium]